jgi:GT2 family glycosyltransferase
MVSIVTVSFNSVECLKRLRASLKAHTKDCQWIVVDSGSHRQDTKVQLLEIESAGEAEVIYLPQNQMFTRATNIGLTRATGDPIVLLNPDCDVTPGWLDAMQAPLRFDRVGVVGAVLVDDTGMVVHGGARDEGAHDGYGEPFYRADAGWALEREHDGWITGACLLITRAALEAAGGRLNERFRHYHSDRFLCQAARAAGYRIWMSSHKLVHSQGKAQW